MSASCTHMSAVLHALSSLAPAIFTVHTTTPVCSSYDNQKAEAIPITSFPCQWNLPREMKHTILPLTEATFKKHDYAKQTKHKIKLLEDFDPRPPEYRGSAMTRLLDLLNAIR